MVSSSISKRNQLTVIHAEETFMFLQPVNERSTATSGIAVMSNYVKPCETWIENETARKLDGTQEGRRPHQGVVQTECGGFLAAAWQLLHRMKIAAMIPSMMWMILAVSSMTPVTPFTGQNKIYGDDVDSWTRGLGPSRYATGRAGVSHGAKQNWSQKFATQYW